MTNQVDIIMEAHLDELDYYPNARLRKLSSPQLNGVYTTYVDGPEGRSIKAKILYNLDGLLQICETRVGRTMKFDTRIAKTALSQLNFDTKKNTKYGDDPKPRTLIDRLKSLHHLKSSDSQVSTGLVDDYNFVYAELCSIAGLSTKKTARELVIFGSPPPSHHSQVFESLFTMEKNT